MCYNLSCEVIALKEKVLPIMVSSPDAMQHAAEEQWTVIYVDRAFYNRRPDQVHRIMAAHNYVLSIQAGAKGVFFLLQAGPRKFCHHIHEIHDPCGIL